MVKKALSDLFFFRQERCSLLLYFFIKRTKSPVDSVSTQKTLLGNCFLGITTEYSISLQIKGVGFKSKLSLRQGERFKSVLKLSLGYSHILRFSMPKGCTVELIGKRELLFKGICYQGITQLVAFIQNFKAPDVYKGKGLNYQYKIKVLKPGKKQ